MDGRQLPNEIIHPARYCFPPPGPGLRSKKRVLPSLTLEVDVPIVLAGITLKIEDDFKDCWNHSGDRTGDVSVNSVLLPS